MRLEAVMLLRAGLASSNTRRSAKAHREHGSVKPSRHVLKLTIQTDLSRQKANCLLFKITTVRKGWVRKAGGEVEDEYSIYT